MKNCETIKLFYSEYPYKIVVSNPLSSIFREKNLAHAKTVLDDLQHLYEQQQPLVRTYGRRLEHLSLKTFFDAKNLYIEFSKKIKFKLRIENNLIHIYSHNYNWLQQLASKFNANEFWEPRIDISKFDSIPFFGNFTARNDLVFFYRLLGKVEYALPVNDVLATYNIMSNSISRNKLRALKYQWLVCRNIANLSIIISVYNCICWMSYGIRKYYIN